MNYGLEEETQKKIIAVLSALFPKAEIYLFGSRARGTNSPHSDIDIALKETNKISRFSIGEAISMFENSCIPYKIQIVDFNAVSDAMRKSIISEGILWKK